MIPLDPKLVKPGDRIRCVSPWGKVLHGRVYEVERIFATCGEWYMEFVGLAGDKSLARFQRESDPYTEPVRPGLVDMKEDLC